MFMVATLVTIIRVTCILKRTEPAFLLVLGFFFISSISIIMWDINYLFHLEHKKLALYLEAINIIFDVLAHWFFASRYLQTSMIMPLQFNASRLRQV